MFYVYILKSNKNKDIYIGFSEDLKKRFKYHNGGLVKSTKANRPWKLIYYESYLDKRDAIKRERQLKNHRAKLDLKGQLGYSLELES
jgi:putative endonuclease